jgi:condensin complex subunit 2
MASLENANPNQSPPPTKLQKRVSISPKKPIVHSPRLRNHSRFTPQDDDWSLDSSDDEPTTTAAAAQTKKKKNQRRRRSSARFLRLSQGGGEESTANDGELASSEHLGEIYRQAIRMNAENKINAGNSWGLKLIENMDKFIEEVCFI